MVMEYIDGETLSALLRQLRPRGEYLPLAVVLQIAVDACEGLVGVHELRDPDGQPYGLVHRDMSPQNLMVGFDGWIKIVDFGLVKATGKHHTHTGHLRGKLAYMSPEQARGKPVTASADLFALGVVLWELLTGKRLFAGESDAETLERVDSLRAALAGRAAPRPAPRHRADPPPRARPRPRRPLRPPPTRCSPTSAAACSRTSAPTLTRASSSRRSCASTSTSSTSTAAPRCAAARARTAGRACTWSRGPGRGR
jgi:serine/threonine protein kinase